jgi:DNA polymerase-3 subunit gamma/tau
MLRTHGDVIYKQEQRFHLELGLLKMVHAQRLLPLEQLLSSVTLTEGESATAAARPPAAAPGQRPAAQRPAAAAPPAFTSRPAGVPPIGGGSSPFGQPASKPSPLEADKARKGREEMSSGSETTAPPSVASPNKPMALSGQPVPQAFGIKPPASVGNLPGKIVFDNGSALAVAPMVEAASTALDVHEIREAVLQAMESGGSQMLVHALEEGEWSSEGNVVSVQVGMSAAMVGVSYTREQEKLSGQAASKAAGRAVKVRLLGGVVTTAEATPRPSSPERAAASGSLKTRAAEEPVVQRMKEKFGAEIRMVMDRSER